MMFIISTHTPLLYFKPGVQSEYGAISFFSIKELNDILRENSIEYYDIVDSQSHNDAELIYEFYGKNYKAQLKSL